MRKVKEVSLQNGYTRIANELLETLCRTPMTNLSRRFLLAVMRLTWGWQQSERKLSRQSIMYVMGITSNQTFHRIRQKLHDEGIVIHRHCGQRRRAMYKVMPQTLIERGKILDPSYTRNGASPCPLPHKRRVMSKEILKKVKKEQKVSQPVDNSKVNVHIHNYLGSALNANPSKEAGRLINDREALSNL